jgi:hypothetical protein
MDGDSSAQRTAAMIVRRTSNRDLVGGLLPEQIQPVEERRGRMAAHHGEVATNRDRGHA